MQHINAVVILSIIAMLSGLCLNACAPMTPEQKKALLARFEPTPAPICTGDQDCKAKMDAAQAWVASNCAMKIQIATDTVIETYNPPNYSTDIACKVIKSPLGDGKYNIVVRVWCDNLLGCYPQPVQAVNAFNTYIDSIKPAQQHEANEAK